jgi:hypothetical protein
VRDHLKLLPNDASAPAQSTLEKYKNYFENVREHSEIELLKETYPATKPLSIK